MTSSSFRRDWLTRPIFSWARKVMPEMSDTEREALEAGDVWWDADLFTGTPDWQKLLAYPPARLSASRTAGACFPLKAFRLHCILHSAMKGARQGPHRSAALSTSRSL